MAREETKNFERKQEALVGKLEQIQQDLEEVKLNQKKLETQKALSTQRISELRAHHNWIDTEKEFFGVAGHRYHFEKLKLDNIRAEVKRLIAENEQLKKRINLKVDSMFEKTQTQYEELQKKKELTRLNKQKFEDTILELDELKNQEIVKTWKEVN